MAGKAGLLALIAMATMTSGAMADCRTIAFNFHPNQNDSVSTTGLSAGGSACTHRFRSWATLQITSTAIVSRPGNGNLTALGALGFRYQPKAGFKGVDRYSVRICGTAGGASGCSTISYAITVE